MNKDAVYVEEQPKHSIASIIIVNDPVITENVHKAIDNLGKETDLIFVFNESLKGDIMIPTFTRLYSGCAYICGSKDVTFSQTMMTVFDYCNEVFNKHVSFLITDTTKLDTIKITDKLLDKVYKVTLSELKAPILEKVRLGTDELQEIYVRKQGFFKRPNEWVRSLSTHRSNSQIIYIRRDTIENLMTLLRDKKDLVKNFIETDVSYFLTSVLVRNGIEIIDQNIENLKFNGKEV